MGQLSSWRARRAMRGVERRTISNEVAAEIEDGRREAVSRRRNFIRVGGNRRSDLGVFYRVSVFGTFVPLGSFETVLCA
jgi:hypothetical protein